MILNDLGNIEILPLKTVLDKHTRSVTGNKSLIH